MSEPADLYEILQVHPSAHPEVIQAAYRRLAQIYHPDRNPAADAGERMAAINRAYEVLGDPQQRAAYDRQRAGGEGNRAGGAAPVPDVVRAKSFQLVNDAGQTRAELSLQFSGEDNVGWPELLMYDQHGNLRFQLSLGLDGSPSWWMFDESGLRIWAYINDEGDSVLDADSWP